MSSPLDFALPQEANSDKQRVNAKIIANNENIQNMLELVYDEIEFMTNNNYPLLLEIIEIIDMED